jgi:hypothetical protein
MERYWKDLGERTFEKEKGQSNKLQCGKLRAKQTKIKEIFIKSQG